MAKPSLSLVLTVLCYGLFGGFVDLFDNAIKRLAVPLMSFVNGSVYDQFSQSVNYNQGISIYLMLMNVALVSSIVGMFTLVPIIENWQQRSAVYAKGILLSAACVAVIGGQMLNLAELLPLAFIVFGLADSVRAGIAKVRLSEEAPEELRAYAIQSITVLCTLMTAVLTLLGITPLFGTAESFHYVFAVVLGFAVLFMLFASCFPKTRQEPDEQAVLEGPPLKKVSRSVDAFHGTKEDIENEIHTYHAEARRKTSVVEFIENPFIRECLYLVTAPLSIYHFGFSTIVDSNFTILMTRFGWSNSHAVFLFAVSTFLSVPLLIALPWIYGRIGRRPTVLTNMTMIWITTLLFAVAQVLVDVDDGPTNLSVLFSGLSVVSRTVAYGLGCANAYMVIALDIVSLQEKVVFIQVVLVVRRVLPIIANIMFLASDPTIKSLIYFPLLFMQAGCIWYTWICLPAKTANTAYENYARIMDRKRSSVLRKFSNTSMGFSGYGTYGSMNSSVSSGLDMRKFSSTVRKSSAMTPRKHGVSNSGSGHTFGSRLKRSGSSMFP